MEADEASAVAACRQLSADDHQPGERTYSARIDALSD
jgi:hypothetical protein